MAVKVLSLAHRRLLRAVMRKFANALTSTSITSKWILRTLDKVVFGLRGSGHEVELLGMNHASETIIDRLALHDKQDAVDNVGIH